MKNKRTKKRRTRHRRNKTGKAGNNYPSWYATKFTPTPSKSKSITKYKMSNIPDEIIDSLYPAWYKKIPYPTQLDQLYLLETSILDDRDLYWATRAQSLWKKHLLLMKKKLNISTIKNNNYLTLKKGTLLYHTANRILPFHDLEQTESSYPFPSYFFGLSSIISLWYAVEKYTEYKRHQEKGKIQRMISDRKIHSREKPPYYLNIYELTEDLRVLYLTDDIGLNQESSIGIPCQNFVPCLHPQYAYHSIEQLYTKRGPAELDWELTIPNKILQDGFLYRRRYSKKNPFGKLSNLKFMTPPIKPILVYKIDHKLLLQHAYDNINTFDPLQAINLYNPVWKL